MIKSGLHIMRKRTVVSPRRSLPPRALFLLSILFVLLCSGCAGLSRWEAKVPGGTDPVLSRQEQLRLLRRRRELYRTYLQKEVIPRIAAEIPLLIELGFAEKVGEAQLNHVHIRYPIELPFPSSRPFDASLDALLERNAYHLLYHSRENPFVQREEWIAELESFDNPEIDLLLKLLQERSFDYRAFTASPQNYRFPDPVPPEYMAEAVELWRRELAERGISLSVSILRDRVIFLIGSTQPGYAEAWDRLFYPHSIRTFDSGTGTGSDRFHFETMEQVFDKEYWHPATIYFSLFDEAAPEKTGYRRYGGYLFLTELRLERENHQ